MDVLADCNLSGNEGQYDLIVCEEKICQATHLVIHHAIVL